MAYSMGERVSAKWPNSNLWFEGTVIDKTNTHYVVRFDDQDKSEFSLLKKFVTKPMKGRSKRRSSVSPARSRKSSRSPSRGRAKRLSDPKPETPRMAGATALRPRSSSQGRTPKSPTRQSARIAALEKDSLDTKENNISDVKQVDSVTQKERVDSQDSVIRGYLKSFMGSVLPTLQSLPMISIILAVPFVVNQLCTKKKCTVLEWPNFPRKMESYYDPRAVGIVAAFFAAHLILSFIPIGKTVLTTTGRNVRCNGFISLFACLLLVPALVYMKVDVLLGYSLFRQLLVTFTALSVVLAGVLFVKAQYARKRDINTAGNTGCWIPDFIEGREVAPQLGSLEIKHFLFRSALLVWLVLLSLIVIKDYQDHGGVYSPTLLMACILHALYAVDLIWFEATYFTTYEYLKQGCGFMVTAGYLTLPFFVTIYTRFLLYHRTELPWYCLMMIAALNVIGYVIMRGANSQKHAFRSNPASESFTHMESLPCTSGQRLLVSGWWGIVRHPNYMGDILIMISWTLLCGFNFALPWVLCSCNICYLLLRVFTVEAASGAKHRSAWASYKARVPYRLIPKVF